MKPASDFISQAKKLGGLTLAAGVLGFIRELAIAHKFGATHGTDSYLVALSIPSTLYFVLIGSGLNISLVPRLASLMKTDPARGAEIFSEFLGAILLFAALISLDILIFPEGLTRILAPGIASSPLTIEFVRLLAPLLFLFVCSYSLASFECACGHTVYWGMITVTLSGMIILAIFSLGTLCGVRALVFGTLAGAVVVLLLQIHFVRKLGFRLPWVNPLRNGDGLKIVYSMLPFALAFGIGGSDGTGAADFLLLRYFASRLDPGSITLLALGNKLMGLPVLLVGSSLGIAVLPGASADFSRGHHAEVGARLIDAVTYALILICPVFVVFFNSAGWLSHFFFGHGALTETQLSRLSVILVAYTGALLGLTMVYLFTGFHAALQNRKLLILTGLVTVALDGMLMKVLSRFYLAEGLAMAVSIGALCYALFLAVPLIRAFKGEVLRELGKRTALIATGGLGMFLIQRSVLRFQSPASGPSFILEALSMAAALATFAGWLGLFRSRLRLAVMQEALRSKYSQGDRPQAALVLSEMSEEAKV